MRAHTEKCESENWKKKNEGEWTGKLEIGTRNNVLAVGEACVAIFYRRHNYHLDRVLFAVSYSAVAARFLTTARFVTKVTKRAVMLARFVTFF